MSETPTASSGGGHPWRQRAPMESCRWAVIDPGPVLAARTNHRDAAVRFQLAQVCPGLGHNDPIAWTPATHVDGTACVVACSVRRVDLDRWRRSRSIESVVPEHVPEFLRIAVESDRLELLTGDTLPASVRRWRRIRGGLLVLMALLGFVIGVIGVERRGFALREEAARVHDAALELVDLTIPPETAGVSSDPRVRLLTAVRALPESADHDAGTLRDAALDLARVLDLWPAHDGVVLASLVTDQQGWRIVAEAGSAESAQAWAADFRDMQPAARAEIRSNGTRSAITVTGSHEMGPVMRGRQESAARTSGGGRP